MQLVGEGPIKIDWDRWGRPAEKSSDGPSARGSDAVSGRPDTASVAGAGRQSRGVAGDVVVEVSCRVCRGLIDLVPPVEVAQVVGEHFAQVHPDGGLPVEGEQYLVLPASPTCDTCLAVVELPWWDHVSIPAGGQVDHDGLWLLCDACHDLWAGGALGAWVRYAWGRHLERAPWLAESSPDLRLDSRAELAGTLRALPERLDAGRRVTLT